jgi:predicted DNA-binding protein with PD1-like motif
MEFKKVESGYLIRLDRGEEIVETLVGFVRRENIPGGFITGIGSVERATLGVYDYHAGSYITRSFSDRQEVGNLTGNIAYDDDTDEPGVHCHMTLSDSSLNSHTGHLFEGIVLITVEIFLRVIDEKLIRKKAANLGFGLWQL